MLQLKKNSKAFFFLQKKNIHKYFQGIFFLDDDDDA